MRMFVIRSLCVAGAGALLVSGCEKEAPPARAQWLIAVQTDAPVPAVVDRILLELLDESGALACPSCRRDAAAHTPDKPAVSFGVEATSRALYLRTRMYRVDHISTETGQPDPRLTLDNIVRLPALGDQVNYVYASLKLACLGKPSTIPSNGSGAWSTCVDGLVQQPPEASMQPHDAAFKPGTSPLLSGIRRDGCVAPTDDMACLPGGAFFLGSTLAPAPHSDVAAAPIPERLVGVDSFRIDRHEVSVAEFLAVRQQLLDRNILLPSCGEPQPENTPEIKLWCRDKDKPQQQLCTFSDDPAANTQLPMNCVSPYVAAAFCAFRRKGRLPSEAEWEYAASNGELETRYPWGDTRPDCSYAALARDPDKGIGTSTATECLEKEAEGGPVPRWQSDTFRDSTIAWPSASYTTQSIFDMGGNVAEWTSDCFESYEIKSGVDAGAPEAGVVDGSVADAGEQEVGAAEAGTDAGAGVGTGGHDKCWAPDQVLLLNRHCSRSTDKLVVRGGSWRETLDGAWSANRASLSDRHLAPTQEVGFRCACDLDDSGNCCLKDRPGGQCCELRLKLLEKTLECCVGPKCCDWDLLRGYCAN